MNQENADAKIEQFGKELDCNAVLVMSAQDPDTLILMPTDPDDAFSVKLIDGLKSKLQLRTVPENNSNTLYKLPADATRETVLRQAEVVAQESEPINQHIRISKKLIQNPPVNIYY